MYKINSGLNQYNWLPQNFCVDTIHTNTRPEKEIHVYTSLYFYIRCLLKDLLRCVLVALSLSDFTNSLFLSYYI